MILPDHIIRRQIAEGRIEIDPFIDGNVQPASVDLTLGTSFAWMTGVTVIEPTRSDHVKYKQIEAEDDGDWRFILSPGAFVLATTVERVRVPDHMVGVISGKSSLARLGLSVHETAGWVDPGFNGQVTLELTNKSPNKLLLSPGMRICQISFTQMLFAAERPYGHPDLGSKYQGQSGATPSRYVR